MCFLLCLSESKLNSPQFDVRQSLSARRDRLISEADLRRRHVEKDVGHDRHVWRKPHVVVNYRGNKVSSFDWLNWYQMKEEEFLYPFFSQSSIGTRNRIYG